MGRRLPPQHDTASFDRNDAALCLPLAARHSSINAVRMHGNITNKSDLPEQCTCGTLAFTLCYRCKDTE